MTKLLRWLFPILSGLALGIIAGLVYTWLIEPVHYTDTAPDRLRADAKKEYLLLICEAYAASDDWTATQERLAELQDPDIAATTLELAKEAIELGKPVSTIRHLAIVAGRLGASSPVVARFVPGQPPMPPATPTSTLPAIPPTVPPSATATPTPVPTALPTPAPHATPTPRPVFRLSSRQSICDVDRAEPLLQVLVRGTHGEDVSGAEVAVNWEAGSIRLITGFKPELGRGYTDMVMEPGISYTVFVAAGSEPVGGIRATPCRSSAGQRLLSTRLVFKESEPSYP
jgi:hypothetical protein